MKEQLDKYFLGELSDVEKKELFDRIDSSSEDKKEFIRMQNTVTLSKLFSDRHDKDWSARMLNQLEAKIERKRIRYLFLNVAKYAAVAAILIVNCWLLADKFISKEKVPLFTRIEVPKGQRIFMTLPDGTDAWLSPRSVIRIPNEFNADERTVELDGEGFFSVTKDVKRPFIVKTQHYNIQVLGTKFNVFAYSESKRFETNLVEGSVQVTNNIKPLESIVLKPNEMVSLVNDSLVKSTITFNNEEYLKSGIFYFSNKQFSEIVDYLSLWYNVRFKIKDSARINQYVSGKFRQSDDIERVLKALQGVHSFNYKIVTNEEIEIY